MQRTVIVPPEAGYGQKGMNEIPVRTYKLYMRKEPSFAETKLQNVV